MGRYEGGSPGAWMKDAQAKSSWLGDYPARDGVTDSIPAKGIRRYRGTAPKVHQHGSAS